MGLNPFQIVRDFETALCEYTGAPYCVTTTSCTMALLLAVAWHLRGNTPTIDRDQNEPGDILETKWHAPVEIPKFTYIGVPMSIWKAGGRPTFRDETWRGMYQLAPLPVWDSARLFSFGLWSAITPVQWPSGHFVCVSFHPAKTLGISTHGGAILHDSPEADEWLRMMRFDGRTEGVAPKDDTFTVVGHHCYMAPPTAAEGLERLSRLPRHNEPLPWGPGTDSDYPDLSAMEIFR